MRGTLLNNEYKNTIPNLTSQLQKNIVLRSALKSSLLLPELLPL